MRRNRFGRYIVLAGPDGTGKTTVAEQLVDHLPQPVLHVHHRPHILGGLTMHDAPVTEPHKDPPYPLPASLAKVFYLFLDFALGWLLRFRPILRQGGTVLLERGWWDLAIDPGRYRLRDHRRLIGFLGHLLPRPAATVLLLAEADVLASRTEELDHVELTRQVAGWRALPQRLLRTVAIDSAAPLETVLADAKEIVTRTSGPEPSWIALPTRREPRWILPRSPGRATAQGLRVYTPVTPRAVTVWNVAWVLARLGAPRILPPYVPPPDLLASVADLLPPGGTVAVSRSTHTGRRAVMVLDARGSPVALAKVADDAAGSAALRREAQGLESLRSHLPPGLNAPALLMERDGMIAYEVVPWWPQLRPWRLPAEVAYLLGRFYSAGGSGEGTGLGHGDCGPWNLLRADDGWYLIDWSDAANAAPPYTDVWHYIVQAHALLGRPRLDEVLEGVHRGRGWVGAAVEAYADGAGLPRLEAPEQLIAYLTRTTHDVMSHGGGDEGMAARRALLAALERSRE